MIVAEPKVIVFDSISPGKLYLMTVSLTNASLTAQRIRIKAPSSDFFALNYIPTRSIAPGLDIRAEIECQLPFDSANPSIGYTDKLIVTMGKDTLEIPIIASKPHSVLIHSPLINFGNISHGSLAQTSIEFTNEGQVDGKVSFKIRHKSAISITPNEFELKANQTVSATVNFNSLVPTGAYRDVIEVQMTNALKSSSVIDINATVLESKLTLLGPNNDGVLQNIDFGLVYYGHKRSIKATLVNSGPIPLPYRISPSASDPTTEDVNQLNYLSFSPQTGIINAFSEEQITISFQPELIKPKKGFAQHFQQIIEKLQEIVYEFILENLESNMKHGFHLQAQIMNPTLRLQPDKIFFGKCSSNDRRDARITVFNPSPTPLNYQFSRHPYIKFTPSTGRILQYQSISVIASFLPLHLGIFRETLELSVLDSPSSTISFSVYGEANEIGTRRKLIGGTDKLPEDFAQSYKFVDQEIESSKFEKHKNRTFDAKLVNSINIIKSAQTLRAELSLPSTTEVVDPVTHKLNMATESSREVGTEERFLAFNERRMQQLKIQQQWEKKKDQDRRYNDYLQQSHKQRLAASTKQQRDKHARMKTMDDIVLDY
jgi:hypothetical protein